MEQDRPEQPCSSGMPPSVDLQELLKEIKELKADFIGDSTTHDNPTFEGPPWEPHTAMKSKDARHLDVHMEELDESLEDMVARDAGLQYILSPQAEEHVVRASLQGDTDSSHALWAGLAPGAENSFSDAASVSGLSVASTPAAVVMPTEGSRQRQTSRSAAFAPGSLMRTPQPHATSGAAAHSRTPASAAPQPTSTTRKVGSRIAKPASQVTPGRPYASTSSPMAASTGAASSIRSVAHHGTPGATTPIAGASGHVHAGSAATPPQSRTTRQKLAAAVGAIGAFASGSRTAPRSATSTPTPAAGSASKTLPGSSATATGPGSSTRKRPSQSVPEGSAGTPARRLALGTAAATGASAATASASKHGRPLTPATSAAASTSTRAAAKSLQGTSTASPKTPRIGGVPLAPLTASGAAAKPAAAAAVAIAGHGDFDVQVSQPSLTLPNVGGADMLTDESLESFMENDLALSTLLAAEKPAAPTAVAPNGAESGGVDSGTLRRRTSDELLRPLAAAMAGGHSHNSLLDGDADAEMSMLLGGPSDSTGVVIGEAPGSEDVGDSPSAADVSPTPAVVEAARVEAPAPEQVQAPLPEVQVAERMSSTAGGAGSTAGSTEQEPLGSTARNVKELLGLDEVAGEEECQHMNSEELWRNMTAEASNMFSDQVDGEKAEPVSPAAAVDQPQSAVAEPAEPPVVAMPEAPEPLPATSLTTTMDDDAVHALLAVEAAAAAIAVATGSALTGEAAAQQEDAVAAADSDSDRRLRKQSSSLSSFGFDAAVAFEAAAISRQLAGGSFAATGEARSRSSFRTGAYPAVEEDGDEYDDGGRSPSLVQPADVPLPEEAAPVADEDALSVVAAEDVSLDLAVAAVEESVAEAGAAQEVAAAQEAEQESATEAPAEPMEIGMPSHEVDSNDTGAAEAADDASQDRPEEVDAAAMPDAASATETGMEASAAGAAASASTGVCQQPCSPSEPLEAESGSVGPDVAEAEPATPEAAPCTAPNPPDATATDSSSPAGAEEPGDAWVEEPRRKTPAGAGAALLAAASSAGALTVSSPSQSQPAKYPRIGSKGGAAVADEANAPEDGSATAGASVGESAEGDVYACKRARLDEPGSTVATDVEGGGDSDGAAMDADLPDNSMSVDVSCEEGTTEAPRVEAALEPACSAAADGAPGAGVEHACGAAVGSDALDGARDEAVEELLASAEGEAVAPSAGERRMSNSSRTSSDLSVCASPSALEAATQAATLDESGGAAVADNEVAQAATGSLLADVPTVATGKDVQGAPQLTPPHAAEQTPCPEAEPAGAETASSSACSSAASEPVKAPQPATDAAVAADADASSEPTAFGFAATAGEAIGSEAAPEQPAVASSLQASPTADMAEPGAPPVGPALPPLPLLVAFCSKEHALLSVNSSAVSPALTLPPEVAAVVTAECIAEEPEQPPLQHAWQVLAHTDRSGTPGDGSVGTSPNSSRKSLRSLRSCSSRLRSVSMRRDDEDGAAADAGDPSVTCAEAPEAGELPIPTPAVVAGLNEDAVASPSVVTADVEVAAGAIDDALPAAVAAAVDAGDTTGAFAHVGAPAAAVEAVGDAEAAAVEEPSGVPTVAMETAMLASDGLLAVSQGGAAVAERVASALEAGCLPEADLEDVPDASAPPAVEDEQLNAEAVAQACDMPLVLAQAEAVEAGADVADAVASTDGDPLNANEAASADDSPATAGSEAGSPSEAMDVAVAEGADANVAEMAVEVPVSVAEMVVDAAAELAEEAVAMEEDAGSVEVQEMGGAAAADPSDVPMTSAVADGSPVAAGAANVVAAAAAGVEVTADSLQPTAEGAGPDCAIAADADASSGALLASGDSPSAAVDAQGQSPAALSEAPVAAVPVSAALEGSFLTSASSADGDSVEQLVPAWKALPCSNSGSASSSGTSSPNAAAAAWAASLGCRRSLRNSSVPAGGSRLQRSTSSSRGFAGLEDEAEPMQDVTKPAADLPMLVDEPLEPAWKVLGAAAAAPPVDSPSVVAAARNVPLGKLPSFRTSRTGSSRLRRASALGGGGDFPFASIPQELDEEPPLQPQQQAASDPATATMEDRTAEDGSQPWTASAPQPPVQQQSWHDVNEITGVTLVRSRSRSMPNAVARVDKLAGITSSDPRVESGSSDHGFVRSGHVSFRRSCELERSTSRSGSPDPLQGVLRRASTMDRPGSPAPHGILRRCSTMDRSGSPSSTGHGTTSESGAPAAMLMARFSSRRLTADTVGSVLLPCRSSANGSDPNVDALRPAWQVLPMAVSTGSSTPCSASGEPAGGSGGGSPLGAPSAANMLASMRSSSRLSRMSSGIPEDLLAELRIQAHAAVGHLQGPQYGNGYSDSSSSDNDDSDDESRDPEPRSSAVAGHFPVAGDGAGGTVHAWKVLPVRVPASSYDQLPLLGSGGGSPLGTGGMPQRRSSLGGRPALVATRATNVSSRLAMASNKPPALHVNFGPKPEVHPIVPTVAEEDTAATSPTAHVNRDDQEDEPVQHAWKLVETPATRASEEHAAASGAAAYGDGATSPSRAQPVLGRRPSLKGMRVSNPGGSRLSRSSLGSEHDAVEEARVEPAAHTDDFDEEGSHDEPAAGVTQQQTIHPVVQPVTLESIPSVAAADSSFAIAGDRTPTAPGPHLMHRSYSDRSPSSTAVGMDSPTGLDDRSSPGRQSPSSPSQARSPLQRGISTGSLSVSPVLAEEGLPMGEATLARALAGRASMRTGRSSNGSRLSRMSSARETADAGPSELGGVREGDKELSHPFGSDGGAPSPMDETQHLSAASSGDGGAQDHASPSAGSEGSAGTEGAAEAASCSAGVHPAAAEPPCSKLSATRRSTRSSGSNRMIRVMSQASDIALADIVEEGAEGTTTAPSTTPPKAVTNEARLEHSCLLMYERSSSGRAPPPAPSAGKARIGAPVAAAFAGAAVVPSLQSAPVAADTDSDGAPLVPAWKVFAPAIPSPRHKSSDGTCTTAEVDMAERVSPSAAAPGASRQATLAFRNSRSGSLGSSRLRRVTSGVDEAAADSVSAAAAAAVAAAAMMPTENSAAIEEAADAVVPAPAAAGPAVSDVPSASAAAGVGRLVAAPSAINSVSATDDAVGADPPIAEAQHGDQAPSGGAGAQGPPTPTADKDGEEEQPVAASPRQASPVAAAAVPAPAEEPAPSAGDKVPSAGAEAASSASPKKGKRSGGLFACFSCFGKPAVDA